MLSVGCVLRGLLSLMLVVMSGSINTKGQQWSRHNNATVAPPSVTRPSQLVPRRPQASIHYLVSAAACSDVAEFEFDYGSEFPGADGSLECCDTQDGAGQMCLKYDFTQGGHYVGARYASEHLTTVTNSSQPPMQVAFAAEGRPQNASQWGLGVHIADSSGQVLSASVDGTSLTGKMGAVSLDLDSKTFNKSYGGASDGQFHYPIVGIDIIVYGHVGEVLLGNVSFEFSQDAQIPIGAAITTRVTSVPALGVGKEGVFMELGVETTNRILAGKDPVYVQTSLGISKYATNSDWQTSLAWNMSFEKSPVEITGWTTYRRNLSFDTSQAGYFPLVSRTLVKKGGDVQASMVKKTGVVVRPNPVLYGMTPSIVPPGGVFGLQRIGDSLEESAAAAAIGVQSVRFQPGWGYSAVSKPTATSKQTFSWAQYDRAFQNMQAHKIGVLLEILPYPPAWAANASHRDVPNTTKLDGFKTFALGTINRYKDSIVGLSVGNEPDDDLVWKDKIPVDEVAVLYASWLNIIMDLAAEVLPDIPVGGLPESGGAWVYTNLSLCKKVLAQPGIANRLKLFTAHPYMCCGGDSIGSSTDWDYPSQGDRGGTLIEKMTVAKQMLEMAGASDVHQWPSEFGWALEKSADPESALALAHAAAVAQSLVLMRSLPEPSFGRFYLFAAREPGYEMTDASFGLWRDPVTVKTATFSFQGGRTGFPVPAAAAYATASALLELPSSSISGWKQKENTSWVVFDRPNGANKSAFLVVLWQIEESRDSSVFNQHCYFLPSKDIADVKMGWTGLGAPIHAGKGGMRLYLSPLPTYFLLNSAPNRFLDIVESCIATDSPSCSCP